MSNKEDKEKDADEIVAEESINFSKKYFDIYQNPNLEHSHSILSRNIDMNCQLCKLPSEECSCSEGFLKLKEDSKNQQRSKNNDEPSNKPDEEKDNSSQFLSPEQVPLEIVQQNDSSSPDVSIILPIDNPSAVDEINKEDNENKIILPDTPLLPSTGKRSGKQNIAPEKTPRKGTDLIKEKGKGKRKNQERDVKIPESELIPKG